MEALAILVVLAVIGGWFLGVIAFFKVMSARTEIAALRRMVAGLTEGGAAVQPPPLEAQPEMMPEPAASVVAPVPEPIPELPPETPATVEAEPAPVRQRADIEALLTARWGVWLGAAALVLAGVFLIRYAVEEGLLGPAPRCALAALLGLALLAAAEWLRRREIVQAGLADQAAPGLAAGGAAILFGAAYGAGPFYGLVSPVAGFVLLAFVSVVCLGAALRYGQLVAAVGIVGAFTTPLLVETPQNPSIPGLFAYLLFVSATALAVVRYTAWIWLAWATTIAGALWVLVGIGTGGDMWAPALFVPAVAALNLGLLPGAALDHVIGRRLAWVPCAVLGATGLLLALDDQGWVARIAVLLFVPLTIWHAARESRLRLLPFLAALLFLLLLAGWSVEIRDLPDIGILPDAWSPSVVREMLATAALIAGCFAASGLWFERRAEYPLPWASLAASIPVLALLICYARVAEFEPDAGWAIVAVLLAAGLSVAAADTLRHPRHGARERAGIHAAGAVAALALGCAMLLREQWLTLAVSLFLPALAWIAGQIDVPGLRKVALAVAVVVLIRLVPNFYTLTYAFGPWPVANGLVPTFALPAVAFALAAIMFRRQRDDLTVGVLEAGSIALATVFLALEVRHSVGPADGLAAPAFGFAEAALDAAVQSVFAVSLMRIAERLQRPVLQWGWRIQGAVALFGAALLIVVNPLFTEVEVGTYPLLDWLLPAYLLPALLALVACRSPATAQPPGLRTLLGAYALVAAWVWITLEVRHLFHPGSVGLESVEVTDAELWAWSGAWLAYGVGIMALGIATGTRSLRLAALAIVGITTAKVFLVDMSDLVGLWRVLSFLGLGLVLIGLGAVYRRLVAPSLPAR